MLMSVTRRLGKKIAGTVASILVFGLSLIHPQALLAVSEFCAGHGADSGDPQINTALGCIPVDFNSLMATVLPIFFGIAGGVSFLIMVYGFILMATSAGDPKAVAGAQETVTSAIIGLLVSIFAIFIVRLVLLNILHIPGVTG